MQPRNYSFKIVAILSFNDPFLTACSDKVTKLNPKRFFKTWRDDLGFIRVWSST